ILLASDAVAIEDRPRLVTEELHRDALGDTGADVITSSGAAEVMEHPASHARTVTSGAPGMVEIADRPSFVVKDVPDDDAALSLEGGGFLTQGFQRGKGLGRQIDRAPLFILRCADVEPQGARLKIHLPPLKVEELVFSPTRPVRYRRERPEVVRELSAYLVELLALEEAFADIV